MLYQRAVQMPSIALREQRLSVPNYRHTIWSTIVEWTRPLVSAYTSMIAAVDDENRDGIINAYHNIFSPVMNTDENSKLTAEQAVRLASSSVLSIWMLSQRVLGNKAPQSFQEAENWFLGKRFPSQLPRMTRVCDSWPPKSPLRILSALRYDSDFEDLFPYIVEIFETLTVQQTRRPVPLKRCLGLFYTPSDVSKYIVYEVLAPWKMKESTEKPSTKLNCLDPACGSGVFPRAVLDWYDDKNSRQEKGQRSRLDAISLIYGMDLSRQAIQSCAFTLLLDCMGDVLARGLDPWCVWQAIRGNLAVVDSTRVIGCGASEPAIVMHRYKRRFKIRKELLSSNPFELSSLIASTNVQEPQSCTHADIHLIGDIFPEMSKGFSAIVGNPPYSKIKKKGQQTTLTKSYLDNEIGKSSLDVAYLPFVKMMWRFAHRRYARAGMVLPLSLAYHSGKHFRALRQAIMIAGGKWHFGFFDRTPDSLFGDDIKTRNCIALAEFSDNGSASIATTSLMRWNSQNRKDLYVKISFTELGKISIEPLVPKIGSELELLVYKMFRSRTEKLGSLARRSRYRATIPQNYCVFFRSTAYNWLPLYRSLPAPLKSTTSAINNDFRRLEFTNPIDADFAFAVASSRISYWLWRVEGDGFHLNESFLAKLPFHPSAFPKITIRKICHLSHVLWKELQRYPMEKLNAGVLTVSYRPYGCTTIIDDIDKLLVKTYQIPDEFLNALQQFVTETIVAGRIKASQSHLILKQVKS